MDVSVSFFIVLLFVLQAKKIVLTKVRARNILYMDMKYPGCLVMLTKNLR